MDTTPNRGYPYPQCLVPTLATAGDDVLEVRDPADAPPQTQALAEAIDNDLSALGSAVSAAYDNPTGLMHLEDAVSISSLSLAPVDDIAYASGINANVGGSAFYVPVNGWYLATVSVMFDPAADVESLGIDFIAYGTTAAYFQGSSPSTAGNGQACADGVFGLTAGGSLAPRVRWAGDASASVVRCWYGITMLAAS
jgi:hypothetical protein